MKHDVKRMLLSAVIPLFILFILYMIQALEIGMDWDFTHLGVYPQSRKGVFGIFAHPLVHGSIRHLLSNTLPLFFLMWCLFYFYKNVAALIFFIIWIGCGVFTFIIGKPGWHIGASGIIYGLAFFLFFSGLLRKHIPLVAISLLIAFLYGGLVWNMFPFLAKPTTSWEGHLSGAVTGIICAFIFRNSGPQRPVIADDEEEEWYNEIVEHEEPLSDETDKDDTETKES